MGLTDKPDYEKVTKLYMEMEICSDFIGCWHWEFEKQKSEEKLKWYLFREMKIDREDFLQKERKKIDEKRKLKVKDSRRILKGRIPKMGRR